MTRNDYPFSHFLGVDVSKATLDFALADGEQSVSIKNTEEQIVKHLIGMIDGLPTEEAFHLVSRRTTESLDPEIDSLPFPSLPMANTINECCVRIDYVYIPPARQAGKSFGWPNAMISSIRGAWNMLRPIVITVAALIILPSASIWQSLSAADVHWPGWLGPKRNGWVSYFQPPKKWPDQLKRSWQVEVGTGYGSPLVTGGRVYQHARQGDDEVLWCFNLNTGAVVWRQKYAVPFKIGGGAERHGKGPKSSPVLADGRIFTMSITGTLSAWDAASGKLLWRSDYGSRFKKSHPYWGAATSPIVDGKRIIVHFGTDDEGSLVALDVENGKPLWSQGKHGPSYSSPLLEEIHGIRQIIEWNHETLVGVESNSGRLLWEVPFPHVGHDQNMPTPAFHQGCVLLGGENRGVRSLKPQLDGGVWTVKEQWYQAKVALDMSSAVVNGNLLYGFSHYGKGQFFCLDTRTGNILWQGPERTGDNVMFLSIPGHVIAQINDGQLQVIAASGDRFQKVASYRVSENQTWAPPVLLPNGILVKDSQTLALWLFEGPSSSVPIKKPKPAGRLP